MGMIIRPKLRDSEQRQMHIEQLRAKLSKLKTVSLLALFEVAANAHFGGYYAVLALGTHFKAAFGPVDLGGVRVLPASATVKDAVIDALASVRTFHGDPDRDAIRQHLARCLYRAEDEAMPLNREVGTFMSLAEEAEEMAGEAWISFD